MSQAYYQLLVGRLSGQIADRRSRRLAWIGDRYRKLAQTNRLIVEVRERIKRQKAQIRVLEHEERNTRRATAFLRQLEMTLHLMNGHRAVILQRARACRRTSRAALMQGQLHRGVPMSSPATSQCAGSSPCLWAGAPARVANRRLR